MREPYQLWPSGLATAEIDKIIKTAHLKATENGTVFSSEKPKEHIRKSTVRWISEQWIKDLLWDYVQKANRHSFNVRVNKQAEMQFIEYHAALSSHYSWHHDVNWNEQSSFDRKLSVTVQLSDPSDYDGGEFEFDEIKTNADFKSKGTVLIFPSYLRHRVCPVKSGTRISLVAWFFGPRWA